MGRKHRGMERIPVLCYCSAHRKNGYTEANALAVLQQVRGHQGKRGKIEQRAYKCPWGDHWHLTSSPEDIHGGADT
jgi:hypothetical protein